MGENVAVALALFCLIGVSILMIATWVGHLIGRRGRAQEELDAAQVVHGAIDGELNRNVFGILSRDVNLHILAPELLR